MRERWYQFLISPIVSFSRYHRMYVRAHMYMNFEFSCVPPPTHVPIISSRPAAAPWRAPQGRRPLQRVSHLGSESDPARTAINPLPAALHDINPNQSVIYVSPVVVTRAEHSPTSTPRRAGVSDSSESSAANGPIHCAKDSLEVAHAKQPSSGTHASPPPPPLDPTHVSSAGLHWAIGTAQVK